MRKHGHKLSKDWYRNATLEQKREHDHKSHYPSTTKGGLKVYEVKKEIQPIHLQRMDGDRFIKEANKILRGGV